MAPSRIGRAALGALGNAEGVELHPAIEVPERYRDRRPTGEEALREVVRGRPGPHAAAIKPSPSVR